MKSKVLVTGGAGFLGNHLCRFLLENNQSKVMCLDNFFTGKRKNIKDLEEKFSKEQFEIIPHDITESFPKQKIGDVDYIYNLACPASPIHYQFDPIETIKANTVGVVNILEFAKLNGAKILQASTSETYGDPDAQHHPQKEDYRGNVSTLGPRACYDEGKRVAETLFMAYHRKFELPIAIVRIFNTYGPNMDKNDGRVISNFIMQAIKNEDITIYGTGEQTRSFCYVEDNIKGLYAMMQSDEKGPVNIGNPGEFTIKQLAENIIRLTNSKSKLIYCPLPQDDPQQRKPDIALANEKLGWKPKICLEEGLIKTIEYFKKTYL